VKTDTAERKLCAEGDVDVCFRLGIDYSESNIKPRDYVLASVFLTLSCDWAGKGCFQLGMQASKVMGYSREEGRRIARAWLDCRRNIASACFDVGETYQSAKVGTEPLLRDRYDNNAVSFYIRTRNIDPAHSKSIAALDAMGVELLLDDILVGVAPSKSQDSPESLIAGGD